jgi:hypothetical protein
MLAVISALREWRYYLEGAHEPFTLVTDHQPNVYLDSATNVHTVHRRARWLSVSCGYTFSNGAIALVGTMLLTPSPGPRSILHIFVLCSQ